MDQVNCRTLAHNGWHEMKDPNGGPAQCVGQHLCGTGGVVPEAEAICKHAYTSGDLKFDHPCRTANAWNETCIKEACMSHSECGGYQKRKDGSTYWLHAKGTKAQKHSDGSHECWEKPLEESQLQKNCTCLPEHVMQPSIPALLMQT